MAKELNMYARRMYSGTQWANNAARTERDTREALAMLIGLELVGRFATIRIDGLMRIIEVDVLVRPREDNPEDKRYRRRPGERDNDE